MQPCISTTIFAQRPLADVLPPIARAGFKFIEISRNSRNWGAANAILRDLGLNVWAVHGRIVLQLDSCSEEQQRMAVDEERAAMDDIAAYAPCPYVIHFLCGSRAPEPRSVWVKTVDGLLRHCEELNLSLAVEALPYKPEALLHHAESLEVAAFVRSVQSRNISVCFDINHVNITEKVEAAAANFAGLISNIHFSDNHGQGEEHLPPGEGVIDFVAGMRAVRAAGYAGPVNLEVHVGGEPSHELLVRLRESAESIDRQAALPS